MAFLDDFKTEQERIKPVVILWLKRLYVLAGNFYVWFWLIRELFCRKSASFENYIMWAFLSFGFYWFILGHTEIFFKTNKDKK